jgi:Ni/Co efflux regulator RcnB
MKIGLVAAIVLAASAGGAVAAPDRNSGHPPAARGGPSRPPARNFENHQGPGGYQRVGEPQGWNARPSEVDRGRYNHNYRAARTYHVGVYHRPQGWVAHRWSYGQYLPRAYWTPQYIIADYWLFALEVPPVGCEWIRDDDDALLVNTATGEILQVEYGVFA